MKMIAITCTSCSRKLAVKDDLAGKKVKCPNCGNVMLAPALALASPSASPNPPPSPLPAAAGREASQPDLPTAPPPPLSDATRAAGPGTPEHDAGLTDFLAPAEMPDELGRLGGFRILKILGHGGMGVVFVGEDTKLTRKVAIKAMLPHLAGSTSSQQRFLREARAAAALEHDHIVPILQVGEERGAPFIVMPLLKGESLHQRLRREGEQALPVAEVLRIGHQTAKGLQAAHEAGLVHRDIKPANLWLETVSPLAPVGRGVGCEGEPWRVKILDFGLARASGQESSLTSTGAIMGTPAYMAPEQGRGEVVDHRCDLWSLGVVLYRLCTGQMPFKGNDAIAMLLAVASTDPLPPARINPEVPADLSALVMRLLEKDPAKRLASAHEVVAAIQTLERQTVSPPTAEWSAAPIVGDPGAPRQEATLVEAKQRPTGASPPAKGNRKLLLLGAGGVLAALLCGIAILLSIPERTPSRSPPDGAIPAVGGLAPPSAKEIINSIGMKLMCIPSGTFTMGSPKKEQDEAIEDHEKIIGKKISDALRAGYRSEGPQHEVQISKEFWLGIHEVTQKQWREVMGRNPSWFCADGGGKDVVKGMDTDDFPVENVSWDEAQGFLKRLSALKQEQDAGRKYRLPTEAEWEYACRAGAKTYQVFTFGHSLSSTQANFNGNHPCGDAAKGPYLEQARKVGSYEENAFGLMDMHGNVWEWCADWYDKNYYTNSPRADPAGPAETGLRVIRGGGWFSNGISCRSAFRFWAAPGERNPVLGFRVAAVPATR
jgi:formylglycine-generating enzyme required for sulfatase activity